MNQFLYTYRSVLILTINIYFPLLLNVYKITLMKSEWPIVCEVVSWRQNGYIKSKRNTSYNIISIMKKGDKGYLIHF